MADLPTKLQEEKQLRTLRARRRLKAIFRTAMHNMYWLLDDEVKDDDFADEKESIKRIVTRQARQSKSGALTIKEKSILRKRPCWRTDAEKRIINKYLGGLRCFRRYPEDVQYKLVAVSYFEYFGPNRVLVRQNHEAHAMYFILSGEVAITREVFDEIENKWITQEIGKNGAGSMFGEVSLLHGMKRSATATTLTPCEFLTLKKEDFNNVLKETIKARWDEIRDSMRKFNYFDYWDEITISECCILSKIKTYDQNQVILGDGMGKSSQAMVYFVIEGECAIIEHLLVIEKVKKGIKTYELYEPEPEPPPPPIISTSVEACVRIDEKPEIIPISCLTFAESKEIQNIQVELNENKNDNENENENENENIEKEKNIDDADKIDSSIQSAASIEYIANSSVEQFSEKISFSENASEASIHSNNSTESHSSMPADIEIEVAQNESLEASSKSVYPTIEEIRKIGLSERPSMIPTNQRKTKSIPIGNLPKHVKVRFMQVCTLGERSTFSNHSILEHRRIIALTPVKCILIPTYWLIQHNKGNVWTRVMQYFDWRMPTHEQVFKKYVAHKKWTDYKKKLVSDLLPNKRFGNNTTIHDVPYSIRVLEEID